MTNNLVRVVGVSENSIPGEKNRSIRATPEQWNQDLRLGDIIASVNEKTSHVEIHKELHCAFNIEMEVVRNL